MESVLFFHQWLQNAICWNYHLQNHCFFGKFSCGMGLLYMVNPPEKGKNKLNSQTAKGRSFRHTWHMQILSQSWRRKLHTDKTTTHKACCYAYKVARTDSVRVINWFYSGPNAATISWYSCLRMNPFSWPQKIGEILKLQKCHICDKDLVRSEYDTRLLTFCPQRGNSRKALQKDLHQPKKEIRQNAFFAVSKERTTGMCWKTIATSMVTIGVLHTVNEIACSR